MDWRGAYLVQARSDYERFAELRPRRDVALSHKLHYLQMASEKLAKGFLTPRGAGPYERTHDAFQKFVRVARSRPDIRSVCRFKRADQYEAYIDSLLTLAGRVQNLSPEGEHHPNPEYPWEDAAGQVVVPCRYDFADFDLTNPKMLKLVRFIEDCFDMVRAEP